MHRSVHSLFVVIIGLLATVVQATPPGEAALQAEARQVLQDSFPGAKVRAVGDLVLSVYGRGMDTGETPAVSAERFRSSRAPLFGVPSEELRSGLARRDDRQSQPVSYNAATGQYKFTLFYYSQFRDDIPVFRAELRVLVRNDAPHPVVLANSSLRPLGSFDAEGRAAQVNAQGAIEAVQTHAPNLDRVTNRGLVIWAGVNQQLAVPTLAYMVLAENDAPEQWLYLVDASTGNILYREDRIQHVDVTGSVNGSGTPGAKAETCTGDLRLTMPYTQLSIGATTAFSDADGQFVIPNAGTDDVTVMSPIRGEWFRVTNWIGSDEVLSATVTPPGPVDFSHNGAATEQARAQVNAYVHANIVRDHVLTYNPSFPTMQVTDSPVYVNRTDGFCPGNAWWDPGDLSINFCLTGGSFPNTAFGSVIYHEYGHHLVNAAGSGQDQYGEGFGDVMSVIISDDPGLGYGFTGSCTSPLRTAENNIQYPCTAGSHDCAGLLSGAVWETRNELVVTEPDDYRDIISNLSVNSVLLHAGSNITPQVAIDFLTLDDDDADLENGTPHRNEICTGFGRHNLNCPPLVLIEFEYPEGLPELVSPGAPTTIRVNVVPNIVAPIETTGTVSYRMGGSGAFRTDPMTEIVPNQYEAVLPATSCGESVQFFFTAQADASGGLNVNDPIDSPTTFHSAIAATAVESIASFDFETTTGWSVSGDATDGQWGAGVPAVGNRGDPPSDFDGSGRCYLTDNVAGNSDVDGGTTILTSPAFDLTGMNNVRVSYARWYSNVEGDSPQADTFFIKASNDGSNFTTMETVGPSGDEVFGGWFTRSFLVADTVEPNANVQFRFEVGDLGSGSIVEAALDAFEIINVVCGVNAPATAPSPHDARKNRYVSFVPNNADVLAAFRVELVAGPGTTGMLGWVGEPDANDASRVVADPFFSDAWPAVVHVGDCEIVPVATYAISATVDSVGFSSSLHVETILEPTPLFYGDCVGSFDAVLGEWSAPQGVVNFSDVSAAVLGFQVSPDAPHVTWIDVADQAPNYIINFGDIALIVRGFQGETYPPAAWDAQTPGDCP